MSQRESRPSKGDELGGWTLVRQLGQGGNAWVWKAEDVAGRLVALKILKVAGSSEEPVARFRRELKAMHKYRKIAGVMPLLGSFLPSRNQPDERGWLAMPLAVRMDTSLRGASLVPIVRAVSQIADTLAQLASVGCYHRDLKSTNLFLLSTGRSLVGDLGLVTFPEQGPDLTRAGRAFAPRNYRPAEVFLNPAAAQPGPVDVYCLGMTLWGLVSGQTDPTIDAGPADAATLKSKVVFPGHPGAAKLDRIISSCVKKSAAARPDMQKVSRQLADWLTGLPTREVLMSRLEKRRLEQEAVTANLKQFHPETPNDYPWDPAAREWNRLAGIHASIEKQIQKDEMALEYFPEESR